MVFLIVYAKNTTEQKKANPMSINENASVIIEVLERELPPIFSRKFVEKATGGLIKRHNLSNLDSKGEGPPSFRVGRKVGYEKQAFIKWITQRIG